MVCYGIIRPVIFVTLPWTLHQTKALQTQSHWPHTMCLGLILHDLFASFFLKYISSFFYWFFRKSGILRMRALPATYVEGFHDLEAVKKMKYQPLGQTGMDVSKLSFGKVVSESFNQMQKCWDTPTKNRPFWLQIAAIRTSVRYKTHALPPLHPKQEPINWWTPVQSCSSKFWVCSSVASNLDKMRRGDHKFVNTASLFGPLGFFLEICRCKRSLPSPLHTSHHITLHHITSSVFVATSL